MIKRILFVQHQKEVSALFACLVRELGYEVSLAAGLADSRQFLESKPHDLICIEAACPDCNSIQFAKMIRGGEFGPGYAEAPVFIFDSQDRLSEAALADARRSGLVQRFLKPPIVADEMVLRLSSILGTRDPADFVPVLSFEFLRSDLARLIFTVFKFRFSGQMTLTAEGLTKILFFDAGRLVSAASSLSTDRIGNLMIVKGAITENQLNEALIAAQADGRMIGEELKQRGWVSEEELTLGLIEQSERIFQSLFFWEKFEIVFSREPGTPPPGVSIPLHPFTLIATAIRTAFSSRELEALLPDADHFLLPCADRPARVAQLPLKEEEKKALERIDGQTLFLNLADQTEMSREEFRLLIATLTACGFIEGSLEPARFPVFLGRNPDPSNLAVVFEEEFFATQTIKSDPAEPPPITTEELAKALQKLEEEGPDEMVLLDHEALEEETFRDIEGMRARRSNPVSYLVVVAFVLGVIGIAIAFLSINSGPPKNLSKQKNVDAIGGDLKPLFTEAIDLYNTGLEYMKSNKSADLKEAKRCFILSLEIVPDYGPAEEALKEVEARIEMLENKKSAPSQTPSAAKDANPS